MSILEFVAGILREYPGNGNLELADFLYPLYTYQMGLFILFWGWLWIFSDPKLALIIAWDLCFRVVPIIMVLIFNTPFA
jgi:hypothetical protein